MIPPAPLFLMNATEPSPYRAALLDHLESLFRFAQALTPDADTADALVKATYDRALSLPRDERLPADDRTALFRLMRQVRDEEALLSSPDDNASPPLEALHDLRRRLTDQFLEQSVPTALATLPGPLRQLLFLCEMEGFSCEEAAAVLGRDSQTTCAALEQARATLEEHLRAQAAPAERTLLATSLGPGWLAEALRRTAGNTFEPLPPALRPALTETVAAPEPPSTLPALRKRPPPRAARPLAGRLQQAGVSLLIILTAGLSGYFLSMLLERTPDVNLINLTARQAEDVAVLHATARPEEAERFVLDQLGWRLIVPAIDAARLEGVGLSEVAPGVQVPVILFRDDVTEQAIALYAYTYTLLDRFADRVRLEAEVLRQIEEEQHYDLYDLGEQKVLIWRNRNEIYLAVTEGDAEELRQRISFPS